MKSLLNYWSGTGGMLVVLALLSSCVPIIETHAAAMNLTASDLDPTFELVLDEGFEEQQASFAEEILVYVNDVSRRAFLGSDRILWSRVISFSSPTKTFFNDIAISTDMNMAHWLAKPGNDICRQFGRLECKTTVGAVSGMVPWYDLEGGNFGEMSRFTGVGGNQDTVQAYVLTFQRRNVVVVLEVVGLLDTLKQSWVEELARTLETKIE